MGTPTSVLGCRGGRLVGGGSGRESDQRRRRRSDRQGRLRGRLQRPASPDDARSRSGGLSRQGLALRPADQVHHRRRHLSRPEGEPELDFRLLRQRVGEKADGRNHYCHHVESPSVKVCRGLGESAPPKPRAPAEVPPPAPGMSETRRASTVVKTRVTTTPAANRARRG